MEVRDIQIAKLKPAKYNPRKIAPEALARLQASMSEFGLVEPIVVNQRTGYTVVGGHQRLKVLESQGLKKIPCAVIDIPASREKILNIALNNQAMAGEFDISKLTGFDESELERIANWLPSTDKEETEPVPELPKVAISKTGDIWELGKHRLMCGDSTKAQDVKQLMGKETADLLFTSPPYANQRDYGKKIADWDTLMQGAFANLLMKANAQLLVNLGIFYSEGEWVDYWTQWAKWMSGKGWRRFGWYVWDKISAPPGDWCGRCGPAHEWIFHFNRESKEVRHIIPKKRASVKIKTGSTLRYKDGSLHTANYSPYSGLNTHKIPDSVWRFNVARTGGKIEVAHPAVFPVDLPLYAIDAFSETGAVVYDPFLGSGTTAIAAEKLGRRCYAMEIEPRYVDVAVKRWQNFTGKKAKNLTRPGVEIE